MCFSCHRFFVFPETIVTKKTHASGSLGFQAMYLITGRLSVTGETGLSSRGVLTFCWSCLDEHVTTVSPNKTICSFPGVYIAETSGPPALVHTIAG